MKCVFPKVNFTLVSHLWQEYIVSGRKNDFVRNKIIENYLFFVQHIARRLHSNVPREVNIEDLFSAGVLGLISAINKFEPSRGTKFENYGFSRIRGAILDELRKMDWVPRLVRAQSNRMKKATQALIAKLGREPTHKELARNMNLSIKGLQKLERDAHAISLVSFSQKLCEINNHRDVQTIDSLEDKQVESPGKTTEQRMIKSLFMKGLSRAERFVIIYYYFEDMTMKEIAKTLGFSESRISQIHSAILKKLKSKLLNQRAAFFS